MFLHEILNFVQFAAIQLEQGEFVFHHFIDDCLEAGPIVWLEVPATVDQVLGELGEAGWYFCFFACSNVDDVDLWHLSARQDEKQDDTE